MNKIQITRCTGALVITSSSSVESRIFEGGKGGDKIVSVIVLFPFLISSLNDLEEGNG